MKEPRAIHFPGLHGLRFIAALAVVIGHVELMKQHFGLPNRANHPAIYELGRISVTFFFVLSGFLITYILLAEKRDAGAISLKKFYLRRILRIWPLYFLTVILAFAIIPRIHTLDIPVLSAALGDHQASTLPLFIGFLPQVALILFPPVPYAEPLWSIGVEEQFYLLWPLVVARASRFLSLTVGIVIGGIVVKEAAFLYASTLRDADGLRFWNHVIDYFYFTRIECMAIGAIAAWIVFERKRAALTVLYSRPLQVAVYALSAYLIVTAEGKPLLNYSMHSVLFAAIILNIATNPRSLVRLDHRVFLFLGNISYGVYMLHEMAIGIAIKALGSAPADAVLYAGSLIVTVAAATIVYHAVELPFLRIKRRLAVVPTGPSEGRAA